MTALFDNATLAALEKDTVPLCLAVEIIYPMGPVRVHSGVGDILISGLTYKGVGGLGGIDPISQTSKTEPGRVNLSMTGLDATLMQEVINTRCQGSFAKIWLVVLDEQDVFLTATLLFSGRVSSQKLKYGADVSISIELVDRLADWSRKNTSRFSDENHKSRHPDDRFFRYVAQMSEKPIYWGSDKTAAPFRYN
jgi:hypothetical protein